jgi:hypothetical protein
MRLLVSFEEEYHSYRDVIASSILTLRPHIEVSLVEPHALQEEVARICPHLVISSSRPSTTTHVRGVLAWLRLPTGDRRSAELWHGEERSEVGEAGLEALLGIVDETERLKRAKDGRSIREEDDGPPVATKQGA